MPLAPNETRPSPDALLKAAQKEARGKFKIFFGAAPGVGKTYQMLVAAQRRKAEGLDVIARKQVDYKGRALEEMDLDAALARRPQLVLVDELAHTNAAGSRHPK